MDIDTHYFSVKKTARYSTYGNLNPKTKYFWFALHGSKMTCEQMLYKFKDFDPETHFVVAPEALNRFYANGFGGDVVASWMTKRDRLEEIKDFSEYLNDLFKKYMKLLPANCKTINLGFSQGGTTLYRWLHAKEVNTDFIIAYSCWIPEDIDLKKSKTNLKKIPAHYTYGIKDQFLKQEVINKLKSVISKNELKIDLHPYEGDHRVSKNQLKYLFEEIITPT